MSEKTFPFLKFHRTLPREVPVPVRVLGFGEIHEGFANGDAGDQASRCEFSVDGRDVVAPSLTVACVPR